MSQLVTTIEQALGHFIDDRGCPTVYIEVVRDTELKQENGPTWVALDLRGKVGRLCGMRQSLHSNKFDVIGIGSPALWGPTPYGVGEDLPGTSLLLERVGEGETLHLAVTLACGGEGILFESIRFVMDAFLIDVANGRRYFGNVLSDEDLEALVIDQPRGERATFAGETV